MPSLKKELHLTRFQVQWRSKWKTIWVRYLNLQILMLDQRKQVLNITSLQTQLRRPSRWCSHSLLTREMVHSNLLSKETLYIQRKTYFTILVQELITQLNHKTKWWSVDFKELSQILELILREPILSDVTLQSCHSETQQQNWVHHQIDIKPILKVTNRKPWSCKQLEPACLFLK